MMVFREQQNFIDRGPEFYKQWGSYFGRSDFYHPLDIAMSFVFQTTLFLILISNT